MSRLLLVAAALALAGAASADPIFGVDIVGRGMDASTLEQTGLPIVALTYDMGQKWTNPIYRDQVMDVPDQFIVQDAPESLSINFTMTYNDTYDYQKKTAVTHKHHGFLGFGSRSKTVVDYTHRYFEEDKSFAEEYQTVQWFTITMPPLPPPQLHPRILAWVKTLPPTFNPDPASSEYVAWAKFIAAVGTHYVTRADMGGYVKGTTWYHKCFLKEEEEHWVTKQSGWSFFGIIGDKKGSTDYKDKVDIHFKEESNTTVTLRGGDVADFKPADWLAWRATVKDDMTAIQVGIEPLSTLIPDPARAGAMEAAVKTYMAAGQADLDALYNHLKPPVEPPTPAWCKRPTAP